MEDTKLSGWPQTFERSCKFNGITFKEKSDFIWTLFCGNCYSTFSITLVFHFAQIKSLLPSRCSIAPHGQMSSSCPSALLIGLPWGSREGIVCYSLNGVHCQEQQRLPPLRDAALIYTNTEMLVCKNCHQLFSRICHEAERVRILSLRCFFLFLRLKCLKDKQAVHLSSINPSGQINALRIFCVINFTQVFTVDT